MTTVSPFYTWRRAMTESSLPSTTKLVLFVVAEYTNAMDETCWPSLDTIADKATLSRRAVTKHLAIAEKEGWLTRWKSRRPDRQWAHAHYRLSIPETIAVRQRDAIDLDLAADSDADETLGNRERGSIDAQKTGELEPRATNSGELPEPRATNAAASSAARDESESYWHHVPTNYPVNGDCIKPSLSNPTVVNEVTGVQREKPDETSLSIAQWMFERLRADDPGVEKPDLDAWALEVDAMLVVDDRSLDAIAKLFAYARRDPFWQKVITSPARLRKNWAELRTRRNSAIAAKQARSASVVSPVADARQCAHIESGCRCTHPATTIIGAGSTRRGYCRTHIGQYED
jgi:hypothetical protein